MSTTTTWSNAISRDAATEEDEIKNRILDAADRLLAESGYEKMTIDTLAESAGVKKSVIYRHFENKEEVVLAHVDRIVSTVLGRLSQIAASQASPANKLKRMLVARVMIRFESVQHYTESLMELLRDVRAKLLERREEYFQKESAIFARVITHGQRSNIFRKQDPLIAARTLIWATNSLLPFSLSTREMGMPRTTEEAAAQLADLLLNGLMRPEKSASPSKVW